MTGTYTGGRIINDADSHLMETPDWLIRYADTAIRDRLRPLDLHGLEPLAEAAVAADTPEGTSSGKAVMAEKNWRARGAFRPDERAAALDVLGFRSQLVFSTYSHVALIDCPGVPGGIDFDPDVLYGAVRAHNRGMVDFCRDPRLLPVGWVALDDPERAIEACAEALAMGCAAIEVPTYPVGPFSLTHPALHPVYRMLEEAGRPLVFHVGGGGPLVHRVYADNGLADRDGSTGHDTTLAELTLIGMPAPVQMAVAALIFDGVFERFPGLRCGIIEQGATWAPGFQRWLDLAPSFAPHSHGERLSMAPGEYFRRQVKLTPFPFEDVGRLIGELGPDALMFGSDYPHDEGGDDPLGRVEASLTGRSEDERDRFYRRNFEVLMGRPVPCSLAGTPRPPDSAVARTTTTLSKTTEGDAAVADAAGEDALVGRSAEEGALVGRSAEEGALVGRTEEEDAAVARTGETLAVLQKKALFRLLARDVAERAGVAVSREEITEELHGFVRQTGLGSLEETLTWMRHEGVTDETFRRFLEDARLLGRLAEIHAERLGEETATQLRISTARTWTADKPHGESDPAHRKGDPAHADH
ncbi:amidohydrolase family protein [Actinomadura rupiterrae]|uniref:amidohydrolase family protein n=1 Tax=Actinomadura rupiterrae TaxID=559627 RepID=UPI0020A3811F|nr:amidohydrolase family protein [Actinomadura rupiterrae]MCP2336566.1 putative TIM-barrel fold metal-dependent hydrolase [Actinomadura rupiterrae]